MRPWRRTKAGTGRRWLLSGPWPSSSSAGQSRPGQGPRSVCHCSVLLSLCPCRQQQGEAGCDPEALERSPAFRAPLVDHRLHFLSAMLLPWAGTYYLDKKKKRQEVPAFIVRESLKLRNKDASDVATLLSLVPRFRALSHQGREATRYAQTCIPRGWCTFWAGCWLVPCTPV